MTIPAQSQGIVPTDISIAVPEGTYGRVAPRSGLAVKHFVDTGAGVVDYDYRVKHNNKHLATGYICFARRELLEPLIYLLNIPRCHHHVFFFCMCVPFRVPWEWCCSTLERTTL